MVDRVNMKDIFMEVSVAKPNKSSFSKLLKEYLIKLNMSQHRADKAIEDFLAGKKDVYEVMLMVEKADISFRLFMKIRNKLIEAYQEIMRMQV